MAAIINRKKSYSVVYTYTDKNGEKKQKWETWRAFEDAKRRKAEIENQLFTGAFVPPKKMTIAEFMAEFVSVYGERSWSLATYDGNMALIRNYIIPVMGDIQIQSVNARMVDQLIRQLQKTESVTSRCRKPRTKYLSPSNIDKILTLLKSAFNQAVRWEFIAKNPFLLASGPKVEYQPREIWTAEMIRTALDQCRDSKLYIAMNLSFACSLRLGEVLGLTWDNVHISDVDLYDDNAYVYINKELVRVSKKAIETLDSKDVLLSFPAFMARTTTQVILKTPKTKSSIRKIWLPKTVAYILREWKQSQDELKQFFGEDYRDYNLVLAQSDGRPCEGRIIEKAFQQLREEAGLPRVVFHSLRHSSTTYKLKLNNGDLKATQGDTGHAEIDMITKVYAHILDEDRKLNAQKFETAFYSNPDLREVHAPAAPAAPVPPDSSSQLAAELQKSPALAGVLATLIHANAGTAGQN